jgi:hypothetical protein
MLEMVRPKDWTPYLFHSLPPSSSSSWTEEEDPKTGLVKFHREHRWLLFGGLPGEEEFLVRETQFVFRRCGRVLLIVMEDPSGSSIQEIGECEHYRVSGMEPPDDRPAAHIDAGDEEYWIYPA